MDVSIIIVNYNTKEITLNCIESILKYTKNIKYEIILVDNASSDGSKETFQKRRDIKYIYNSNNLGFGKANNIGAQIATGSYLFLLNSDTIIIDNVISKFFHYMVNNKEIVSCGANLINSEREITYSHGNFPSLIEEFSSIGFYKFYNNYYRNHISLAKKITEGNIENVDYICGADIFIKKSIFDKLGGFDEDYFMYYEETDLFYRLKQLGYKARLLADTNIIHLEGASTIQLRNKPSLNKFKMLYKSKILYYRKNKPSFYIPIVRLFNIISLVIRYNIYKDDFYRRMSIIINTK